MQYWNSVSLSIESRFVIFLIYISELTGRYVNLYSQLYGRNIKYDDDTRDKILSWAVIRNVISVSNTELLMSVSSWLSWISFPNRSCDRDLRQVQISSRRPLNETSTVIIVSSSRLSICRRKVCLSRLVSGIRRKSLWNVSVSTSFDIDKVYVKMQTLRLSAYSVSQSLYGIVR